MSYVLLTIAGTDPSGAAGIQVDLQVFRDFGFHGASAITAVLWQDTVGVHGVLPLEPHVVRAQLESVVEDLDVRGVKIGLVPNGAMIDALALSARDHGPVVWDPVFASGSGDFRLVTDDVPARLVENLRYADVLTPNIPEAQTLLGRTVESLDAARDAAEAIVALGANAVLLKTGHLSQSSGEIRDVWADDGGAQLLEALPRIEDDVRGTGCQLSSALLAGLAGGLSPLDAAQEAREYLNRMLRFQTERIGKGRPVVTRTKTRTASDDRT